MDKHRFEVTNVWVLPQPRRYWATTRASKPYRAKWRRRMFIVAPLLAVGIFHLLWQWWNNGNPREWPRPHSEWAQGSSKS